MKNRINGKFNGVNGWVSSAIEGVNSPEFYTGGGSPGWLEDAYFMKWKTKHLVNVVKNHTIMCCFAMAMVFFMGVEYTLAMIPSGSEPFDIGFGATRGLHGMLAGNPGLNTLLAGLNTSLCGAGLFGLGANAVFVAMQTMYIMWTWLIEGRPRATISAILMFTCRGILGYSTQLPLPKDFLGSGADFPVGNVSFFLFYSGHVAASVIASLDMKRMKRWQLARAFDVLNALQFVRLLTTRGHYTIDLAVGIGAGILFDSFAGRYEESKKKTATFSRSTSDGAKYTPISDQMTAQS